MPLNLKDCSKTKNKFITVVKFYSLDNNKCYSIARHEVHFGVFFSGFTLENIIKHYITKEATPCLIAKCKSRLSSWLVCKKPVIDVDYDSVQNIYFFDGIKLSQPILEKIKACQEVFSLLECRGCPNKSPERCTHLNEIEDFSWETWDQLARQSKLYVSPGIFMEPFSRKTSLYTRYISETLEEAKARWQEYREIGKRRTNAILKCEKCIFYGTCQYAIYKSRGTALACQKEFSTPILDEKILLSAAEKQFEGILELPALDWLLGYINQRTKILGFWMKPLYLHSYNPTTIVFKTNFDSLVLDYNTAKKLYELPYRYNGHYIFPEKNKHKFTTREKLLYLLGSKRLSMMVKGPFYYITSYLSDITWDGSSFTFRYGKYGSTEINVSSIPDLFIHPWEFSNTILSLKAL